MKNIFLVCIVSCCTVGLVHGMERPEEVPNFWFMEGMLQRILVAVTSAQGVHAAAAAIETPEDAQRLTQERRELDLRGNTIRRAYEEAQKKSWELELFKAREAYFRTGMEYDAIYAKLDLFCKFIKATPKGTAQDAYNKAQKKNWELEVFQADEESLRDFKKHDAIRAKLDLFCTFIKAAPKKTALDLYKEADAAIGSYYERVHNELQITDSTKRDTTAEEIKLTPEQLDNVKLLYIYNIWLKVGGSTSGINLTEIKDNFRRCEMNIEFAIKHGKGAKYLQLLRSPEALVQAQAELTKSEAEWQVEAERLTYETFDEEEYWNIKTNWLTRFLAEIKKEDSVITNL